MKNWYYNIICPDKTVLTLNNPFHSKEEAIEKAIDHIISDIGFDNGRYIIDLYDYPAPFGDSIHHIEFNIWR